MYNSHIHLTEFKSNVGSKISRSSIVKKSSRHLMAPFSPKFKRSVRKHQSAWNETAKVSLCERTETTKERGLDPKPVCEHKHPSLE